MNNISEEAMIKMMKQALLEMLKDKENILKELLDTTFICADTERGINKVIKSIETGSEKNLRKQVKNFAVSLRDISKGMRKLTLLNIIYLTSSGFDKDISELGMKLGGGKEFLQQMIKNKFGGKNPFEK